MICDNAWNAGIVLGAPVKVAPDLDLNGLQGHLKTGSGEHTGKTDDPMGALAWVANLAASRGLPLAAGQVAMTLRVMLHPLDRTLNDPEVEAYRAELVRALDAVKGVRLRRIDT